MTPARRASWRRTSSAGVLLASVAANSSADVPQPMPSAPVDRALDSMATLTRRSAGDASRCVAFLVADDLVLTARHCVAPYRRDGVRPVGSQFTLHFEATDRYAEREVSARVVAEATFVPPSVQSAIDWALLRTEVHVPRPSLRLARGPVAEHTPLALVRPGRPTLRCSTALRSLVAPHVDDGHAPVVVLSGCPFEPGDSGAPLLDATGAVVALATARDVRPWPTHAPLTFPDALRGARQRPRRDIGYATRVGCIDTLAREVDPGCDEAAWRARSSRPGEAADAHALRLRAALDALVAQARAEVEDRARSRPLEERARVEHLAHPTTAAGARIALVRACAADDALVDDVTVEVVVDEDAVPRVVSTTTAAAAVPPCAGRSTDARTAGRITPP